MKKVYRMENLDCANCAAKMEAAILKIEGVASCTISFMTQKMTLETENLEAVKDQIVKVCRKVEPDCIVHF